MDALTAEQVVDALQKVRISLSHTCDLIRQDPKYWDRMKDESRVSVLALMKGRRVYMVRDEALSEHCVLLEQFDRGEYAAVIALLEYTCSLLRGVVAKAHVDSVYDVHGELLASFEGMIIALQQSQKDCNDSLEQGFKRLLAGSTTGH